MHLAESHSFSLFCISQMPFGEVMYRCNAHYCFGMFRNRAVGLLTTLALMQLFLFSFYLNGLHNQGVVDRSGEQLQQSLVASSVFVDTSVSKNAEGGDGEPVKVSTQQHQPQPESAPRHVDGPGKVNVNQLVDLLNKSSKNAKVDALQMFAKASLADRDGPLRGLSQLSQRLLTDNNGSAQGVGDAARKALANVFDKEMDTKKYGDLAKLGMQLFNGLPDQAKQTAVSGMMETAAQLMMPQKTPLENVMAKSAIGLLTGALGNQKMDTMSVINIAAKMFQANRPDDRGAASPMNLLNKLVGSVASQTPLAASADQNQLYSDYVKYSRKRSTRRKLDKVPLRFNYASGQACSAANTYVFLVVSTARQSSRRQVARESWITVLAKDPRFAVRFLIGQPEDSDRDQLAVDSESRLHNDIIEVDVKESSSFSSTLKTLAALEWAQANCPSVRSVLKIQDDIYINPSKMIQVLDDYLNTSSIIGNIAGPAAPGNDLHKKNQ